MGFVRQGSAAVVMVAFTLCFQCAGMVALMHWGKDPLARCIRRPGRWPSAVLLLQFMSLIICLHMLEILSWAWLYRWLCFPSWELSFYFSATSYSSVGYGDVLLPGMWRTLGPIESVTGILMCGLSVSLVFAIVTRLVAAKIQISSQSIERLK